MSTQNDLIAEQLERASAAVTMLKTLQLTVLKVRLGDLKTPRIEIQPGRGCERLHSGIDRWIVSPAGRRCERVAYLHGAEIHWLAQG
jgi:hypothetical protein